MWQQWKALPKKSFTLNAYQQKCNCIENIIFAFKINGAFASAISFRRISIQSACHLHLFQLTCINWKLLMKNDSTHSWTKLRYFGDSALFDVCPASDHDDYWLWSFWTCSLFQPDNRSETTASENIGFDFIAGNLIGCRIKRIILLAI